MSKETIFLRLDKNNCKNTKICVHKIEVARKDAKKWRKKGIMRLAQIIIDWY